jgi:hypothetical protein
LPSASKAWSASSAANRFVASTSARSASWRWRASPSIRGSERSAGPAAS